MGQARLSRRALRLHETATILTTRHGGKVPADRGRPARAAGDRQLYRRGRGQLRLRPAARRARHQRAARAGQARRRPARGRAAAPSVAERRLAESLLPAEPAVAARWSVAVMELGALVCTAASPRCGDLPGGPRLRLAGRGPAQPTPAEAARRRTQRYDGTDRQCRGRLLAVLRDSGVPVQPGRLRRGLARPGPAGPGPGRAHRRRPGRPPAGRPLRAARGRPAEAVHAMRRPGSEAMRRRPARREVLCAQLTRQLKPGVHGFERP